MAYTESMATGEQRPAKAESERTLDDVIAYLDCILGRLDNLEKNSALIQDQVQKNNKYLAMLLKRDLGIQAE